METQEIEFNIEVTREMANYMDKSENVNYQEDWIQGMIKRTIFSQFPKIPFTTVEKNKYIYLIKGKISIGY